MLVGIMSKLHYIDAMPALNATINTAAKQEPRASTVSFSAAFESVGG